MSYPYSNTISVLRLSKQLSSLALKLVPLHPTRWPDWILQCVTSLSGNGASNEYILDFLAIVAEEVKEEICEVRIGGIDGCCKATDVHPINLGPACDYECREQWGTPSFHDVICMIDGSRGEPKFL